MNVTSVTNRARSGATWALIIAAGAMPVFYLRNWLLGRVDTTGGVAGTFTLILILAQGAQTFFFPGGGNVLLSYYPKLNDERQRGGYLLGNLLSVFAGTIVGIIVLWLWPELIAWVMRKEFSPTLIRWCMVILPFLLLSTLAISLIKAQMSFALATVLRRVQLIIVTTLTAALFLIAPERLTANPETWLGAAVGIAAALVVVVAIIVARRERICWPMYWPTGSIRFAGFAWLDTVLVFAFMSVDQLFVNARIGREELGIYFILLGIAQIIPRAVQELGHMMLTTFSRLLGMHAEEELAAGYRRVGRLSVGAFAILSIVIIYLARPLGAIFNETCAANHQWLIWLAVTYNLDALLTVNTMTLMAYEKMPPVLTSKLLQNIVQFTLIALLIPSMGVFGVIAGKAAGNLIRTIVLILAVRRLKPDRSLATPTVLWMSQLIVVAAALVAHGLSDHPWLLATVALPITLMLFLLVGRFGWADLRAVLPARWRTGRTS